MNEITSDVYRLAEEFSMNTGRCLFITGKAGTGKTTFLRKLREQSPKNMAVVAPTGVAAINAGGMTIHSFFQLPIRTLVPTPESYRQLFAEQRMMQRKRNMLYHLELLVIDEISMVRADVLDAIDAVLRHYKYRQDTPFGGVQVIMIGDLFQLSPVVHGEDDRTAMARHYDGPYFFQSRVMQQIQPVYIELDHVFRQQNEQFVRLLNEVRENRLSPQGRALLASRYQPLFRNSDADFHITLTTHNAIADDINRREMDNLRSKSFRFTAHVYGNFPENIYPTDMTLELKIGARVMFVRNDDQKPRRFYNGKQGIVTGIGEDSITVECEDCEIEVTPMEWENIRYREEESSGKITEEVLGSFTQFPLRLAWAITIHKSQGLTFDRVIIDAEQAFAAGQVYVALSRCRTPEGIVLSSPLTNVRLGNERDVIDYVSHQPPLSETGQTLPRAKDEYRLQLLSGLYSFRRVCSMVEQMIKLTKEAVSFNEAAAPFLRSLQLACDALEPTADKFRNQMTRILLSKDEALLQQRLKAAAGYFEPLLESVADKLADQPVRSKNRSDADDYMVLATDLHLNIRQKIRLMQIAAEEPSTEAILHAKARFTAPPMKVTTVLEKPMPKTKQPKKTRNRKEKAPKPPKEETPDTYALTLGLYKAGAKLHKRF